MVYWREGGLGGFVEFEEFIVEFMSFWVWRGGFGEADAGGYGGLRGWKNAGAEAGEEGGAEGGV